MNTRRKDVLIILGDAGFNYYDDKRDDELKKEISQLSITLFCLHGNKENDPCLRYGLKPQLLNSCVEVNGYQPVTLDELIENNRIFRQLSIPEDTALGGDIDDLCTEHKTDILFSHTSSSLLLGCSAQ